MSFEHFSELDSVGNFLPLTYFRKLFRCVESRVRQLDNFHPKITYGNDTQTNKFIFKRNILPKNQTVIKCVNIKYIPFCFRIPNIGEGTFILSGKFEKE